MSSKLILGTAQFGMNYGINNSTGKINKSEVFELLKYAFINGIQILDTAPVYGDAQSIIGEFHEGHPQIKFNVITKIPANYPLENLEELVKGFLLEMNIDCIEVLHFHSIKDFIACERKIVAQIFNSLKHSNRVKSFGVSIYENSEAQLLDRTLIDVVQLPFNLLDNINQRGELINQLKQKKFEIHTRSVFLQGLFFTDPFKIESLEVKNALLKLKEICKWYNCELAHLAINYCLNQENIDRVLIGVDGISQFKNNICLESETLDNSVIAQINDIFISDNSQINPSKWKVK